MARGENRRGRGEGARPRALPPALSLDLLPGRARASGGRAAPPVLTPHTHKHRAFTLPPLSPCVTPPPLFSFLSGSQAKANASAQTIICQVCRSTFVCTSSRASLTDHSSNKHAKHTFEQCFPGFTD
jgi:hypothetical protein